MTDADIVELAARRAAATLRQEGLGDEARALEYFASEMLRLIQEHLPK